MSGKLYSGSSKTRSVGKSGLLTDIDMAGAFLINGEDFQPSSIEESRVSMAPMK